VKRLALEKGTPILQPQSLKDPQFLSELSAFRADLFVVVAFRMLPEIVWKMPPKGTINLHASLLPNYRGAAPIHWAIINGEKKTGLTTFFINERIDCGSVLLQKELAIENHWTTQCWRRVAN
jgi:methionyl-tRNA formyltransferase